MGELEAAYKAVSPFVQGGSFLLLVTICLWLMKWVPKRFDKWDEKDKADLATREKVAQDHRIEVETLAQEHRSEVEVLAAAHQAAIEKLAVENKDILDAALKAFTENARYERETCQAGFRELAEELKALRQNQSEVYQVTSNTNTLLRDHDKRSVIAINGISQLVGREQGRRRHEEEEKA